MTDTRETKIIFLRGQRVDLPEQLETGQIGFVTDGGNIVIGSDVRYGHANYDRTVFPHRNIEILTEQSTGILEKMHGDRMR